jgi:hypothetical protein
MLEEVKQQLQNLKRLLVYFIYTKRMLASFALSIGSCRSVVHMHGFMHRIALEYVYRKGGHSSWDVVIKKSIRKCNWLFVSCLSLFCKGS